MQSVVRGFLTQSAKMDPLEKVRRWKRSLDGYISFRKAVLIALCVFAFILYVGPSIFSWLFSSSRGGIEFFDAPQSCINDKLGRLYHDDLRDFNAHIRHNPWRSVTDTDYLQYVGNGYFGLAPPPESPDLMENAMFSIRAGNQRVLRTQVRYRPIVKISVDQDFSPIESQKSATVVSYLKGQIHTVNCYLMDRKQDLSVDQQVYAHRVIPEVLVQEITLSNPTPSDRLFNVERTGTFDWEEVETRSLKIGEDNFKVISGTVQLEEPFSGFSSVHSPFAKSLRRASYGNEQLFTQVAVVVPVLPSNVVVNSYKTSQMTIITGIAHSDPLPLKNAKDQAKKSDTERRAIEAVTQALGLTNEQLKLKHQTVWKSLWTTGFGISHSMAENAVNGHQINATLYYVLSQSPTPIHSLHTSPETRSELTGQLAYLEGCYGSLPTLHETKNLWKSLGTSSDVNRVVQYWFLNLEVNGCHNLMRAGADGVVQAMVLSLVGLKYRQHHLELDANPKDLHREYQVRRVSYGNETHLNISIALESDNKAVIEVTLDRKSQDYFACDAGCLDPPVKLSSSEVTRFPVKLTDPVTAVLYITSDYEHMMELKHTIHVKEVGFAPAHEHHVIALHKHGNKLGGLPAIFWFSIGSLILIFHVFLIKLIWQEYCSSGGPDKFRSSKYI